MTDDRRTGRGRTVVAAVYCKYRDFHLQSNVIRLRINFFEGLADASFPRVPINQNARGQTVPATITSSQFGFGCVSERSPSTFPLRKGLPFRGI